MARSGKQVSLNQLSFDMASSTNSSGPQNEDAKPEGFAELSAANEALAHAREALDDLRGLAAKVDADGLSADAPQHATDAQPQALLSEILQQKNEAIIQSASAPVSAAVSGKQKVGEILRAAREAGQFAVEDIAAEIKIKPHHLLAIEESRFGDLPSRTYAVGFVRAYAATLNLDVDALVVECRREVAQSMPHKQPQMMIPEAVAEQPLPSMSLAVMTAALAFLLSAVGYVFTRDTVETAPVAPPALSQAPSQPIPVEVTAAQPAIQQPAAASPVMTQPQVQSQPPIQSQVQPPSQQVQQQAQPQAQPSSAQIPQPVVQAVPHEEPASVDTADVDTTHVSSGFLQKGLVASAPVPGKATPPSRIKLKAVQETTVQIFDASGRMIAERVINKGEAFYVPDKSGLTLATTNAGALHMQIDGKEMQPLGEPDEAMHNIPLNPDSLLKYLQ